MCRGYIYEDRGCSSQLKRHALRAWGLTDGIVHKAARNRAFTAAAAAAFGQRWNVPSARATKDTDSSGRALWGYPKYVRFAAQRMAFNLKRVVPMAECEGQLRPRGGASRLRAR